nr:hypothetical protein CPGR_06118 [Mycolicibacter nonchromogenicus]
MALGGNPYGANASVKVVIAVMLTGSDPMIITTFDRSMSASGAGRPRAAVSS